MREPQKVQYRTTADDDPRHIYHNVVVGLDISRGLNNGEPSSLAMWFDHLNLEDGAVVLHVGCGVGYYTAILAHTVGQHRRVIGIELDSHLAARAKENLGSSGLRVGKNEALNRSAPRQHCS